MEKGTSPTDRTALTFPAFLPRVRALLRSVRGAFDLPSILVGVLVVAVMALGVMAVVFGAIPFSQDKAAQQDLAAHRTAQGAARTQDGKFMDSAGLAASGYIRQLSKAAFGTDAFGTCYVGVARSDTGKLFFSTNSNQNPQELTASNTPGCVSYPSLQSLAAAAGGSLPDRDTSGTQLLSWGIGNSGQLGNGSATDKLVPTSLDTNQTGNNFKVLATGGAGGCAFTGTDTYCWGGGWQGQGGNGTTGLENQAPVKVSLSGKTVTALTGGEYFFCAIADGDVYCWGKLNGVIDASPVKVAAFNGKTVTAIQGGTRHVCAIADGDVYCWGPGSSGELGTGGTAGATVPAKVPALTGKSATALAAGNQFTCAAVSDGTYCWGDNSSGQLGIGSLAQQLTPTAVPALSGKTITALTAGDNFTCAVADTVPYCWGNNSKGQLGLGDTTNRNTPVPVVALAGKAITGLYGAITGQLICALADSEPYCWGYNGLGALGTGDKVDRNLPTKVNALAGKTVQSMAVGQLHTAAIIK